MLNDRNCLFGKSVLASVLTEQPAHSVLRVVEESRNEIVSESLLSYRCDRDLASFVTA